MNTTPVATSGPNPQAFERFAFTKFIPPALDDRVVTDHLATRFDDAIRDRPVTIVTAPAGSGKTTALAAWAASTSIDVVWVRLGSDDDEPSGLAVALLEGGRRQVGDQFGARLAQLLAYSGPAPTPRQYAVALVNDLGDCDPVALLLDDAHELADPGTWELLDAVLEHLPGHARLVVGSRMEPPLTLARRRVRGEIAEFGLDDLLLDRDAIARVIGDDTLTPDDIDTLVRASGGWPAAVRLATTQLSANGARTPTSSTATLPHLQDDLRGFFAEEVLAELPGHLRSFLLETSILDELSVEVCDALTVGTDSGAVLDDLDRRNLFVTRHRAPDGDTWRIHDLFTAFLREQVHATYAPAQVTELHRRAANALPPMRALPHLAAANEHTRAAQIIVEIGMSQLETNTVLALAPAIRALPAEVRDADHRLALLMVWPQHVAGDAHAVIGTLAPLRDELIAQGRNAAAAELNTMLAEAYLQLGDQDSVGQAVNQALKHIDDAWRPIVLTAAAWWHYYRNDWQELSRCIEQAVDLAVRSGDVSMNRVVGPGLSPVMAAVDQGSQWLAEAVDRLVAGLDHDDLATLTGTRPARAAASLLNLEVEQASSELRACLSESAVYGGIAWKHQEAELLLMALSRGTGDLATVTRILDDALAHIDDPVYRQFRHVYIYAAMRAQWLAGDHHALVATHERLLAGRPASAHAEGRVAHLVADAMVARVEERHGDALEVLIDAEQLQHSGRCWVWAGMPGLERADILLEQGRAAAAIDAALPTLDVAARIGPGVLLPESRAHRAVLERCVRAGVHSDLLRAVLAASGPTKRRRTPMPIPGTAETISTREIEVLDKVSTGASNRQIAAQLHISEATVKTHLTRILRKLDATSRTHAVARARELRLL